MLNLRAYQNEDAKHVAAWLTDEREFVWWSAGKLGSYPLDPEKLNALYAPGIAAGDWFPKVMEEDGAVCGQLLMRKVDEERVHFGFIVVNPAARGKGLGAAMLGLALEYAFHIKRARAVTLNVFADNAPAIRCYERLGFARVREYTEEIGGEKTRFFTYEKRKNHG
ncbi:MAG: GNAT family N-acetyltransferase [Clostridia bacterium]|nr:GNAT family N-acetyltransferase [Clostridia bacterium]